MRVEASDDEPGLVAGGVADVVADAAADDAVGPLPGRTVAWLAKSLDRALAEEGLSLPQYRLLAFLSEGSAAATALAGHLAVSPPSLTALADGLVARGLVERRTDAADRRRVAHVVTRKGLHALAAADRAVERQLSTLAERLPPAKRRRAVEGLNLWSHALTAARSRRPR